MEHEDAAVTIVLCANTSWYLFNFRRSTIQAFRSAGYTVVCISPMDVYAQRLEEELGAVHIGLPLSGKSLNPVAEARAMVFLFNALRRIRPNFVFNFTIKLNIYGGVASILLRIPYANNVSGLGTVFIHDSFLYRRLRSLYGWVNRAGEHIFFQNRDDMEVFREYGVVDETRATVLPGSGVDLTHFTQKEMPPGPDRVFLMVSRLLGDKGVREFVQAAKILKHTHPHVKCQLLGPPGADNRTAITPEELSRWVSEGAIDYFGETADVSPFLARAHALVLPSYREGMPRTVLEAAATGRPAIVADVPGSRDAILHGGSGWLCEVRNTASLANAMMHVASLDDDTLARFGANARAHMEKSFSEEIVVRAYVNCVKAVTDPVARDSVP